MIETALREEMGEVVEHHFFTHFEDARAYTTSVVHRLATNPDIYEGWSLLFRVREDD